MTTTAITFIAIGVALAVIGLAIYAWSGWETARSLRQVIVLGPEVCEICATISTHREHEPIAPGSHTPETRLGYSQPGLRLITLHQYVPANLVFGQRRLLSDRGSPTIPEEK